MYGYTALLVYIGALLTSARPPAPAETTPAQIEDAFKRFTSRSDVAIVLINQYVRRRPRRERALSPLRCCGR